MEEQFILALDIGTSTIRSYIYNSRADVVGKAVDQVILHYPSAGCVEIDPEELWESVVAVVHNLSAGQISAMGISTQRGTFLTWSVESGEPFHRFITWKDLRADKLVKQWNRSFTWRVVRASSYVLYLLSRSKRFQAGSVLKFTNTQVVRASSYVLYLLSRSKRFQAGSVLKFTNTQVVRASSYVLYLLSRSKRFQAGSVLKFTNTQVVRASSYVLYLLSRSKRFQAGSVLKFTNTKVFVSEKLGLRLAISDLILGSGIL
ncbi:putative glycerol kinase 5 [Operophtera brumata]|uniref:Putative glycerol kinase 5 n=1 Tax=Operophtera brumata TaxID=104452 RepID=A0A0L7K4T9_OPEBR|nr:putative glycerol kinase 5 [Operophtera brumata]